MQLQVEIGFEQLVNLSKKLPVGLWEKLKTEVEKKKTIKSVDLDMESFLLNAPTFNKKQLVEINKTRKKMDKWRAI